MTELAALLVAAWSVAVTEGWLIWASCGLGWTLLVIALIDWRHYLNLIPDVLVLPLLAAGLAVAAALNIDNLADHTLAAVAGYAVVRIVGFVYARLRQREGIGQGDARLLESRCSASGESPPSQKFMPVV